MQRLGDAGLGNGRVAMRPHEQPSRFREMHHHGWKVGALVRAALWSSVPLARIFDNADDREPA